MKKILLLLLLFVSTLSFASIRAPGQSICEKNETIDFCLTKLLEFKCAEYAPKNFGSLSQDERCLKAAKATTKILNPNDEFGEPVIFPDVLESLLNQQAVIQYIHDLRATLQTAFKNGTPFSLWDFTFAATNQNFAETIEWLGVLLQDTSERSPLLHYITDRHLTTDETLEDLTLSLGYLYLANERENITVQYPLFGHDLTKVFYHFYPIAYLSLRLRKSGVDPETALWIPFLFNTTYELRDITPRYWPVLDPKSISTSQISHLKDIYAGYLAGYLVQGKISKTIKWQTFNEEFSSAPGAFMRQQCASDFAAEIDPSN